MKTIVINASPRKKCNTSQIMKSAQKGAESAGAEVEYINLYDYTFKGCVSCLSCKRKDAERCRCYYRDDLTEIIEKILKADALLIGTPIYFGQATSQFRALMERLLCCVMSYDGEPTYFTGKVNVGLFYTMNAAKQYYDNVLGPSFEVQAMMFGMLNGTVKSYGVCNTVQVRDYSKYSMGVFDENIKRENRKNQFGIDLKNAHDIGAELSR